MEVHVIGVFDPGDTSTVILQRPGRHILVLNAHEAGTWNVQVENGAVLEKVYAVGHHPQRVKANVQTRIETESAVDGGPDVVAYQYPSRDANALLKLASIRVARHATSFHGCHGATTWTIGENLATTSNCAAGTYTQYDAVIDCDGDNVCGEDGGDGGGGGGDGGGGGSGSGGSGDGNLY